MRDLFEILFGASSGFGFYQLFSNPSHKIFMDRTAPRLANKLRRVKRGVYSKVPSVKLHKKFELLPTIRFNLKNREIHIHHWISLSVILGFLLYHSDNISNWTVLKSFMAGGVVHGFLYKDRFKIFKKVESVNQSASSKVATKGK